MATKTIASVKAVSKKPSTPSPAHKDRAIELLALDIDFIPNPDFAAKFGGDPDIVDEILRDLAHSSNDAVGLPAHLRRMVQSDLLTQAQETALFREMNYLKFQADALRETIDPEDCDAELVTRIDSLLSRALAIRDHIVQANMRLVMSIVKKFVTPQQAFDELLSDGILTLMQAIEKFDYDRGFRFSTYAYRSIARNAYRCVTSAQKEEARFTRDAEDWAFEQESGRSGSSSRDQMWANLHDLTASLLGKLDRRERFIVRSRYALGAHRRVRTFQDIANKLGVSKERVRQLEQRAVCKLRKLAGELEMDQLFDAAVV